VRSPKQNIAVPDIAELRDELRRVVQMLELLVCAAREGEAASFKVKNFLTRNDLSESQYHKLRRQGRGPRVMSVGSCGVRISRYQHNERWDCHGFEAPQNVLTDRPDTANNE
jgi:hypothetical protein